MHRSTQHARLSVALLGMGCALLLFALGSAPIGTAAGAGSIAVTGISPAAASIGTTVTLSGSGFGGASPTSFVTFAGMRAQTVSWSDTRVQAIVPPRAIAGYAGVTVGGVTSNGVWFAPSNRPHVVALSSSILPVGTNVTIFGSGFGSSQRGGWVTFSGIRAPVVSWSASRIVAVVPVGTRTGYVGVWQDGSCSNGVLFVAGENPRVSALSRTVAFAGDTVTVTGFDFGAAPDSSDPVTLGGKPIPWDTWSDTAVTFTVPPGMKTGYVGVWRNGVSSNGKLLFVAPRVMSVSQRTAFAGVTEITVSGRDFGAGPDGPRALTLGGNPITPTAWNDTTIVFTVPGGAASGYLGVSRAGATSNGVMLYVIPRIESISAAWQPPGSTLSISGSGFGSTPGRVTFAGTNATILSWSDSSISVTVPDADEGSIGVWRGSACSNGKWFWPVISPKVEDVVGAVAPGARITLRGRDFGSAFSDSAVRIGSQNLDVISWSDTEIVAAIPTGVASGYLGVYKRYVGSNGRWVDVKP